MAMRGLLVAMTGLGVAMLTGGLLSFTFGGWILEGPLGVSGLGPFDGVWTSAEYCFLGAVLSAIGAGLAVSGRLALGLAGRA
jgi:hypothetical protein